VEVPAKRIPYFKPSKELKDLVNEDGRTPDAIIPDGTPM
jgi:integration host factor subunit beta